MVLRNSFHVRLEKCVPKNTHQNRCTNRVSCSRLRRQSKRAKGLRFLSRRPRRRVVRAVLDILRQLLCCWKEAGERNGACSTLLLQRHELPTFSKARRKPGTWYHTSTNSCSFYSRTRNFAVAFCHTHGSAPRSPHLPCQKMGRKGNFGATTKLRSVLQEKTQERYKHHELSICTDSAKKSCLLYTSPSPRD